MLLTREDDRWDDDDEKQDDDSDNDAHSHLHVLPPHLHSEDISVQSF